MKYTEIAVKVVILTNGCTALGQLQKICYVSDGGRHREKCVELGKKSSLNTRPVEDFLSSMNFKIQQGVACCLGIKNAMNSKIDCSF